ncbi:MAG: choice-of-anchor E domain-containing protein [Isosphaeraceae bacterium]
MRPRTQYQPAQRWMRGLVWVILPCAMLSAPARGEIMPPVQVKTLPTTSTNFNFVAHPASDPFVFDKYSGTIPLTSVIVTVTFNLNAQIKIPPLISSVAMSQVNYDNGSLTLDSPAGMNLELGGPGQSSVTVSLVTAPETFSQTSTTTTFTENLNKTFTQTYTYTSAEDLAKFVGASGDTFLFPVTAIASSNSSINPANGENSVITYASGQISVQYVPEPASLVLLLLGGGAITWRGLGRRRSRPSRPGTTHS